VANCAAERGVGARGGAPAPDFARSWTPVGALAPAGVHDRRSSQDHRLPSLSAHCEDVSRVPDVLFPAAPPTGRRRP
jgi:hypothetical protein